MPDDPTRPVIRFSCVIDGDPQFAAQAMRWARGLIELARVPPADLIVHHTETVEPDAVAAFSHLGVKTHAIKSVSRQRPHLNKLAQLRSSFLRSADLAVLCDCDTLFITDPRIYFPQGVVAAKVVDRPNPPLKTWDELLRRAGLERQDPDILAGSANGTTIRENRNGGLYTLPGTALEQFDGPWHKWAEWLEDQSDILGKHAFHIDQIAFALSCLELRVRPALLPKALNFPTHLPADEIGDGAPIMLHYHRHVDQAGMLKPLGQQTVDRAIAFANESLARPARIQRKRRLVLHVGLPKTGTSSLQCWCNANAGKLLRQSIRYPTPSADTQMPKHQFIVSELQRGDLTRTAQAVEEGSEDSIILSSEGLTNHLYDFRPAALQRFRGMIEDFHLSVFLVHRSREAWVRSYHKQCEINPRIPAYGYGQGLGQEEFSRLPRVKKLLDIGRLKEDCAAAFGAAELVAVEFETEWLDRFFDLCGYRPDEAVEMERINEGVPEWVFEAVLRVNRKQLPEEARVAWLGTLQRFSGSNNVGLRKHEAAATARGLWDRLDLSLAGEIQGDGPQWAGYTTLIEELSVPA